MFEFKQPEVSRALNTLLKAPVYRKEAEKVWNVILDKEKEIREILNLMVLDLDLNRDDEYAVVKQVVFDSESENTSNFFVTEDFDNLEEEADQNLFSTRNSLSTKRRSEVEKYEIPKLVRQTPLSFSHSYLLLKLRQKIHEHEISTCDSSFDIPVVTRSEIMNLLQTMGNKRFSNNDQVLQRAVESALENMCSLRFLKKITTVLKGKGSVSLNDEDEVFEIMPVIKSFVDAQSWIPSVGKKLEEYLASLNGESEDDAGQSIPESVFEESTSES